MKIAKLEFQLSDYTGIKNFGLGTWKKDHGANQDNLYNAADVEECVNDSLHLIEKEGHEIMDVRTDFVTISRHNNGGCDTVFEHITILYK